MDTNQGGVGDCSHNDRIVKVPKGGIEEKNQSLKNSPNIYGREY